METTYNRLFGRTELAVAMAGQLAVIGLYKGPLNMVFFVLIGFFGAMACFGLLNPLARKGQPAAWAFLGFLGVVGAAVVAFLPDRRAIARGFPVESIGKVR